MGNKNDNKIKELRKKSISKVRELESRLSEKSVGEEITQDIVSIPLQKRALEVAKRRGDITAYDLRSPEVSDAAYKALLNVLRGKPFGDIETIDSKHVIDAIKMVYDRIDPVVNKNLNMSMQAESFVGDEDIIDLDLIND